MSLYALNIASHRYRFSPTQAVERRKDMSKMQAFLPRKACDRCHSQKLRCDRIEGPCTRCTKANITCIRSPSLRRERSRRSKRSNPKSPGQNSEECASIQNEPSEEAFRSRSGSDVDSNLRISVADADSQSEIGLLDLPSTTSTTWNGIYPEPIRTWNSMDARINPSLSSSVVSTSYATEPSTVSHPTTSLGSYQLSDKDSVMSYGEGEFIENESLSVPQQQRLASNFGARNLESIRDLSIINPRLHESAARVADRNGPRSKSRMSWLTLSDTDAGRNSTVSVNDPSEEWKALGIDETLRLSQEFNDILAKYSEQLNSPPQIRARHHSAPSSLVSRSPNIHANAPTSGMILDRLPQKSEREIGRRSLFGNQASTLFLLSCYLCLLDTYDDIMRQIDYDVNASSTFRGSLHAEVEKAKHGEIHLPFQLPFRRISRALTLMEQLLGEMRQRVRSSSSLWGDEEEDIIVGREVEDASFHAPPGNDTTKVAVIATKVREYSVVNRMERLRQMISFRENGD